MRCLQLALAALPTFAILPTACTGEIGGDPAGLDLPGGVPTAPAAETVAPSGLRRLTVAEYDRVVLDLLGDASAPASSFLPEDTLSPFDNDYAQQVPSSALVDGAEALAMHVSAELLTDAARRDSVVGCAPSGPADVACLESFVRAFGRRALRRPLTEEEVGEYLAMSAFGETAGDFYVSVETILWALLQDPAFLYRPEVGTPTDNSTIVRLDSFEIATKLSFLLWGTTPSEELLDAAEQAEAAGAPFDAARSAELAEGMLSDPRAAEQIARFHALWLGYGVLPHEASLAEDMQREAEALLERVVFDEARPWKDVLLLEETFLTPALADHYGLPSPGSTDGGWVSLDGTGRRGLLSQGAFLSNGAAGEDTSPTQRGLAVKIRLLCGALPEPPENVNVDEPPVGSGPCKWDQLAPYRDPGCAGCHDQVDPIGWGLEHFDAEGRYREVDSAGCDLAPYTQVDVAGIGSFRGPAELSERLVETSDLSRCVGTQVVRFAAGRSELTVADDGFVGAWLEGAGEDFTLQQLLLAYVSSPSFTFRNLED